MADSAIIKYIKDTLKAGYSEKDIRSALSKQDWRPDEIEEAFSILRSEKTGTTQKRAEPIPGKAKRSAVDQKKTQPPNAGETGIISPIRGKMGTGLFLGIIGGVVIIINALLVFVQIGDIIGLFVPGLSFSFLDMFDLILLDFDKFFIDLIIGIIVCGSSYMIYLMPEKAKITGMFIITLSIISVFIGDGFLIGGIIAILGGIASIIGK